MARTKITPIRKVIPASKKIVQVTEVATKKATPASPGTKKTRRFRSGTVALRQIRKYQKTTELLIRKAAFSRLVREVAQDFKSDLRWAPLAILVIQEAAEAHCVKYAEDANLCALHAKRVTILPKDLKLVKKLVQNTTKEP